MLLGAQESLSPLIIGTRATQSTSFNHILDVQGNRIEFVGPESVALDSLRSLYLVPSKTLSAAQGVLEESWVASDRPSTAACAALATTPSVREYPAVRNLETKDKKRILVTGGAGFIGAHLVDRLILAGHSVTVLDNLSTGTMTSLETWRDHPNFTFIHHNVSVPIELECDCLYSLACPASPVKFSINQVSTLKANFLGTINMLGLAKRVGARFLLASTSEIYGSPILGNEGAHPQHEDYWGNVNPVGPRSCYDEGKRVAESLTYAYTKQGVDVRVARIFNCYGPRMDIHDGRVVSNFIVAALRREPLTIYGLGDQTRSLTFVSDLVDGLIALMASDFSQPVNLGSEVEMTVLEWAHKIRDLVEEMRSANDIAPFVAPTSLAPSIDTASSKSVTTAPKSAIIFIDAVIDDPPRRKPDTTRAQKKLGWNPRWTIEGGLRETIRYFAQQDSLNT